MKNRIAITINLIYAISPAFHIPIRSVQRVSPPTLPHTPRIQSYANYPNRPRARLFHRNGQKHLRALYFRCGAF